MTTISSSQSYTDAIVAFVDILGFRSMLETRSAHEIQRILLLLQHVADEYLGEVEPPLTSAYFRTV